MKKRILSLALSLCLCLALTPAASATESLGFPAAFQGDGYYISATPYELQDEGWFMGSDQAATDFHEGLILVYRNVQGVDDQGYYTGTYRQAGYADKNGNMVLTFDDWENPPSSAGQGTDHNFYFSEGMCVYWDRNAYLYGYLNRQGEPVIPAQYRVAQPFQDGVAQVRTQDDEYLFIDKTGQVVFSPDDGLGVDEAYGDGMVAAQGYLDNGDYFVGFLDKQGQPAITIYQGERSGYSEDAYLSLRSESGQFTRFSDGYAILADYRGGRTHPAYVIIDTQGNEVGVIDAEPPAYVYISGTPIFSDGLIQVDFVDTQGPGTGTDCYVDIHGNVAFELPGPVSIHSYDDLHMLDGLATPGYNMVDRTGTVIIPETDVMRDLLPALEDSAIGFAFYMNEMYDGIGLARMSYGTGNYYYLLEKHDGTYTGPGLVYDAAAGTIRDGGTTPVDPEPAGDQPSSWAAEQVNAAIAAGLVPEALQAGYTSTATRAQFCALAVELYETVTGSEIAERAEFTDTTDVNVQKMAGIGVINGVGNGQFNPSGQLTREQAATILVRLADAMGQPLPEGATSFADNASIASWALDAVGRAQAGGLMGGIGNNQFSPQGAYTVEQSILTILRLYETVQ